jgi:hypothetical protein
MTGKFSVSLLASLVATMMSASSPLSAEVVHPEGVALGYYSVGNWVGRCRRDGFLDMAEHESCGARLDGFVSISLSRTVKGLSVSMAKRGCKRGPVTIKLGVKALAAKDRAEKLEKQIAKMALRLQKKCGPDGDMYPATKEDLADILTETDGLEF